MAHINYHIHGWIEKIEDNVKEFKSQVDVTDDEAMQFISHQYHLIMLIYQALNNQTIFVGAKPINKSSAE